MKLRVCQDAAN